MKSFPAVLLAASVVLGAGMWMYPSRVLVPQQKAYAAVHGNPRGNLSDLYPRWLGSRELLLHHCDPYSAEITREIQIGYYGRPLDAARPNDPRDQEAFAYPVYVAFLLAPTVKLPFPIVQEIFRWTLAGLTVLSVLLWLRVVRWKPSMTETVTVLTFVLGTFWVVQGIHLQQLTLLVAPMIAASVYLLIRNRQVASGILLGLATVKPQIALPLAGWLMLWACSRISQRWKLVTAFVLTLLTLLVAGELWLSGWPREFIAAMIAYRGYTRHLSPLDELVTPALGIPLAVLIAGAMAVVCWRARRDPASGELFCWITALLLAANLLVIPTIAPYNQLLLLPGVFLLLQTANANRASWTIRLLAWIAAGFLAWPAFTATALTVLSFFTSAVQQFWEVPLWTSIVVPIPITAALAMCVRRMQTTVGEAVLTTSH